MVKKGGTRFPIARIKKIMQTDDDIGKLAVATPFLMSKAVEVFIQRIVTHSQKFSEPSQTGLSVFAVYKCIEAVEEFDFVRELAGSFMTALPLDTPSAGLSRQARHTEEGGGGGSSGGRKSSRRSSSLALKPADGATGESVKLESDSSEAVKVDGPTIIEDAVHVEIPIPVDIVVQSDMQDEKEAE